MSQSATETRDAIVEAVSSVVNQIQVNPESGRVAFGAQSVLCEGLRADINIRNFALTSDEPESLGGTNEGPNPVELVLGAFAACQEIVIAAYAAVLGIRVDSVRVDVNGRLDLSGFFNVSDVRAGFTGVEYKTLVQTTEQDREKLSQLIYFAQNRCPVLDILTNPVPVTGTIQFTT